MATATSSFNTPTLSSISSAASGLVTIGISHGWDVGDVLSFQGLTEMVELNGTTRVVRTVPSVTTCTIGDTTDFTAESTGGADTCNLAVDVSGYLRTGVRGEDVSVAISGTYVNAIHLERALTPDATAWEKVLPVGRWDVEDATVAAFYTTESNNEILRLVSTAAAPEGTAAATLIDAARIIQSLQDGNGNELIRITEDGTQLFGTLVVDGVSTLTGAIAATGGVTGNITGNVSGSAATVTGAAQAAITSLGTLTSLSTGVITSSGLNITTQGIGAAAGTGVVATENGNGVLHQTLLTCTAVDFDMADHADTGQFGGLKVYDFPLGWVCFLGAVCDGDFTAKEPWLDAWAGDMELGTVVPSDAADGAAGEDFWQQLTATETASSLVAAINASGQVATALTESGARWYNGTDTAADMYLNMVTDDDVGNTQTTDAMQFTGTIRFVWLNLGIIAA